MYLKTAVLVSIWAHFSVCPITAFLDAVKADKFMPITLQITANVVENTH